MLLTTSPSTPLFSLSPNQGTIVAAGLVEGEGEGVEGEGEGVEGEGVEVEGPEAKRVNTLSHTYFGVRRGGASAACTMVCVN